MCQYVQFLCMKCLLQCPECVQCEIYIKPAPWAHNIKQCIAEMKKHPFRKYTCFQLNWKCVLRHIFLENSERRNYALCIPRITNSYIWCKLACERLMNKKVRFLWCNEPRRRTVKQSSWQCQQVNPAAPQNHNGDSRKRFPFYSRGL